MKESVYKGKITRLFNTFSHVTDELKALNVLNDAQTREEQIRIIGDLQIELYGMKVEVQRGTWERHKNVVVYAKTIHAHDEPDSIVRLLIAMLNGLETVKNCPYFIYEHRQYETMNAHDLYAFRTGIVERTREYENTK